MKQGLIIDSQKPEITTRVEQIIQVFLNYYPHIIVSSNREQKPTCVN